MRGVILAAGYGSRLRPYTDELPKTLIPVNGCTTILDVILDNLVAAGVKQVAIVVGYAAAAVEARRADLAARTGLELELVPNDRLDRNNSYSLWLARDQFADGALVVNGDTLHPPVVEEYLLAARGPDLLLALDGHRPLTDEAMKVALGNDGRVTRISKQLATGCAAGEYLGACLIEAAVASDLTAALEQVWRSTPDGYYEDAFQLLADAGAELRTAALPQLPWVEVDDHRDLALARELACRY
jgi:choline kinase